ncbi:hypothetical protein M513_10679 [Trichuris suis]|uniref:Uncharacterized protein n=1 Tax=Trichuris suis TaxID=68888 RepID=A0A085LU15_9BILA|nr:hypothetical protein M513_10679 [Trichuris suis]
MKVHSDAFHAAAWPGITAIQRMRYLLPSLSPLHLQSSGVRALLCHAEEETDSRCFITLDKADTASMHICTGDGSTTLAAGRKVATFLH